jgi:hypothetical protein
MEVGSQFAIEGRRLALLAGLGGKLEPPQNEATLQIITIMEVNRILEARGVKSKKVKDAAVAADKAIVEMGSQFAIEASRLAFLAGLGVESEPPQKETTLQIITIMDENRILEARGDKSKKVKDAPWWQRSPSWRWAASSPSRPDCTIEWSSVEPTRKRSECCCRGGTAKRAPSQTETPVAVVAFLAIAVGHQNGYHASSRACSSN